MLAGELPDVWADLWIRPSAACAPGEGDPDWRYRAWAVINPGDAPETLDIEARWADDDDGFLHVFADGFDPGPAGLGGCLAGSDDHGGIGASRVEAIDIAPGEARVVIASTYHPGRTLGPFRVEVQTRGQCAPAAEVCNGLDDDCDGAADEALDGAPCAAGVGRCAPGRTVCAAGLERCEADAAPIDELCNDVDDDCDGEVDEGCAFDWPVVPVPAAGRARQVPGGGLIADPLRWSRPTARCVGTGLPPDWPLQAWALVNATGAPQRLDITARWAPEEPGVLYVFEPGFDPLDSALADGCLAAAEGRPEARIEGLVLAPGARRIMVAAPFFADAVLGRFDITLRSRAGGCVEGWDACDGVDDDCDGRVDEQGAGAPCDAGAGICRAGIEACVAGARVCQPERGPFGEVCNGLDDDCDGASDEGGACPGDALEIAGPGGVVDWQGSAPLDAPARWASPGLDCVPPLGEPLDEVYARRFLVNRTGVARSVRIDAYWGADAQDPDAVAGTLHALVPDYVPGSDPERWGFHRQCLAAGDIVEDFRHVRIDRLRLEPDAFVSLIASTRWPGEAMPAFRIEVETLVEQRCADGLDNDGNGLADCGDPACDCVEDCADGLDNDVDGAIDCLDRDCQGHPLCPGR